MSTTTPSSNETQTEEGAVAQTAGRSFQGWLLIILVFVAGAASLAVELSASRLLAPYFGTSLFVWANLIALILLFSRPILNWSLTAFATFSVSVFIGSLVSVILLFAVPMILLGCVSPFAIRLSVDQVGRSGRTAGLLYAISTCGSIVGTFVPVLVLIPSIGTYKTFLVFAVALLLVSLVGLLTTRGSGP